MSVTERIYRALGRFLLACLLLLALLLNGSVAEPYEQAVHIAAAAFVVLFLPLPVRSRASRTAIWIGGLAICAGSAWIFAQTQTGMLADMSNHPIWAQVASFGLEVVPSISVAPAQSLAALPQLALPVLIFLTVLALCEGKRGATRMWIALSVVGFLIVLLSIVLELFFSQIAFFSRYAVGYSTFSGAFVNRNVSASVFGMAAFALAGTVALLRVEKDTFNRTEGVRLGTTWSLGSVLAALAFLVTLVAIIATQSRAGTLLAIPIVVICIALIQLQRPSGPDGEGGGAAWNWLRALLILALGGGLIVALGDQIFERFQLFSLAEDPRWCAWQGTLAAIRDFPLYGTGFGTFEDVFPAYRDAECGWLDGTWVQAHNGFLELALGLGVPAAAGLVLIAYAVVIGLCVHGLRRRRSLRAIPVLTLGLLLFVTGHSLLDFPLQIPGVALYCAALLGAGCAVCTIDRMNMVDRQGMDAPMRERSQRRSRRGEDGQGSRDSRGELEPAEG